MREVSVWVWYVILSCLTFGIYAIYFFVAVIIVMAIIAKFKPEWLDKSH